MCTRSTFSMPKAIAQTGTDNLTKSKKKTVI